MIRSGNINFASQQVYKSLSLFNYSPLSRFLFEIYLLELDIFFIRFSSDFNMRKNLLFDIISNAKPIYDLKRLTSYYFPIKLESLLQFNYLSLINVTKNKFQSFKLFVCNKNNLFFRAFSKRINYARYLDHILVGLISSKNILPNLLKKFNSFIRTELALDFFSVNIFNSLDYPILFLGFHIRLLKVSFTNDAFSKLKINKKYLKRLLSRNEVYQKRFHLQSVARINSEIISSFLHLLNERAVVNISWGSFRLWTLIFQIESLRFFQYSKLVFSKENIGLFSEDFLGVISSKTMVIYNNYLFDFQLKKLNFLIREANSNLSLVRFNNVLPTDLTIQNFLEEFRKGLFLFYNSFFSLQSLDALSSETKLISPFIFSENEKKLMFDFVNFELLDF
jgi:hypothetical protein